MFHFRFPIKISVVNMIILINDDNKLPLSPVELKKHLCLCCLTLLLTFLWVFNSLLVPPASSPSPPVSLSPSLHTTESRLARSPPPSLGSACRRPTPTTSEASGWPWPRSLASRASLDSISHATRCRRQQQRRRPPPVWAPPEPPRAAGGVRSERWS